ncbi:MAG: dihydropteroate synthase [Acidimicrobiales bacterium]
MHDEPQPTLRCGDRHLVLGARTYVMGVVNITPDSFSDGGRYLDQTAAVRHAHLLLAQGADVLDLGAESTRPGAAPVDEDEELRRLLPVVRTLVADGVRNLSIDTMKPAVARAALAAGAAWVNDVSGLADPELAVAAAEGGADALVVMHARAMSPGRIEDDVVVHGDLVVDDVAPALRQLSERAEAAGVAPGSIVVDPGIGFGKTVRHNLELLDRRRAAPPGRPAGARRPVAQTLPGRHRRPARRRRRRAGLRRGHRRRLLPGRAARRRPGAGARRGRCAPGAGHRRRRRPALKARERAQPW